MTSSDMEAGRITDEEDKKSQISIQQYCRKTFFGSGATTEAEMKVVTKAKSKTRNNNIILGLSHARIGDSQQRAAAHLLALKTEEKNSYLTLLVWR